MGIGGTLVYEDREVGYRAYLIC